MRIWSWAAAAALLLGVAAHAAATHDPRTTATIFVGGFDPQGASQGGTFGEDVRKRSLERLAEMAGLPVPGEGGEFEPNVVATTRYYGRRAPSYYTAHDLDDLRQVTERFGGGVPRYATIVAKYARFVMERSGATRVNFVSGSFGSLVTRWIIEKDLENLASRGEIARWLSFEGVIAGNWAASRGEDLGLWDTLGSPSIDLRHMSYDWLDENLDGPRAAATSPHYSNIVLGLDASTNDSANDRVLTNVMLLHGEFQANDGVQGVDDMFFSRVGKNSKMLGLPPTRSFFHVNHYEIDDHRGAWVHAATFLSSRRRVRVTLERARIDDLHESSSPWWNFAPAEVAFQARVYSRAAADRFDVDESISECRRVGAAVPVKRFSREGRFQAVDQVLFDDFVLDTESTLHLDLWADEIDRDVRYGIVENVSGAAVEPLGRGWLVVDVARPGIRFFEADEWAGDVRVEVFHYPLRTTNGWLDRSVTLAPVSAVAPEPLSIVPNPSHGSVRISGESAGETTLAVFDAAGRLVRSITGDLAGGLEWDGRDAAGRPTGAGVYFLRTDDGRRGKSLRVR